MKIISVNELALPGVFAIRFGRFPDDRGFFTELYRESDFFGHPEMGFMKGMRLVQANENFSKKGVARGLHFQWNPYMGKLVRTVSGHMVDVVLDIRKGSPDFSRAIMHDMPTGVDDDFNEWIWVPPGFAHGNFFLADSSIQYFCSGEYSPGCEAGISLLAPDIDWGKCDPKLKAAFDDLAASDMVLSEKDMGGLSVASWEQDERSEYFVME